jgi:hypothetical protein
MTKLSRKCKYVLATAIGLTVTIVHGLSQQYTRPENSEGRRLFTRETFGGNGRTCETCHSQANGTVSPEEAQRRFRRDPYDPLFLHDGSDDGKGHGVSRMLKDATILVEIPLPVNVSLADDPNARSVVLRRGIPSTLNTPALDNVLMLDGREPDLPTQAANAIRNHAQSTAHLKPLDLLRLAQFESSENFFSSPRFAGSRTVVNRRNSQKDARRRKNGDAASSKTCRSPSRRRREPAPPAIAVHC